MQLVKLTVSKSTTNEMIREIKFNEKGLSLIVDETNKINSGSNIGKSTAVKIINLCLGANSPSSLYKEKDTGENTIVGKFIENNKVVAELECKINGKNHFFKRALYKNGKNQINGKYIENLTKYKDDLNNIVFNNSSGKPSFRQSISKFIRLEEANETALFKFLGTNTKVYEYQAIYEYLFGIDKSKSENVNIVSINENIDKDIEAIYRKNGVSSLKEFETKIGLMKDEVEKFKKAYSEVTVIEDYETRLKENQILLTEITKLESEYAKVNLKKELLKEKIEKEERKIFSVDINMLKNLYEETKLSLNKELCDFKELEEFHNGMVNKRISMLKYSLGELINSSTNINKKLQNLRKTYEDNYVGLNVEIKDRFEEKYKEYTLNNIKLENFINDYNYINLKIAEKEDNLKKKVAENKDISKINDIEEVFNSYFKELTNNIIGEPFAMVLNENDFPVKIIGMNGKPGTGIKKAMITCFDLAHINLIIKKKYHMPTFVIHDKMENIDLKELSGIISETRKFEGQYIFPILSDRIELMGIKKEEIVLSLSSNEKFFRI